MKGVCGSEARLSERELCEGNLEEVLLLGTLKVV
jgi:hypothetical protein